jgi:microfibrillar-associated protein 1
MKDSTTFKTRQLERVTKMPPPSSRMTKNRPQPTRYRPGKAEVEDQQSDEESSEEEDHDARPVQAKAPAPKASSFPAQKKLAVDLSRAGQQQSTAPTTLAKSQNEDLEGFVSASESSEEEEESESGEEDGDRESSEEEESSSDDEPKKPMLAPKFISKAKRAQQPSNDVSAEEKAAEDERLRKEKADAMLQAQLERDAAARAAGRKDWDDEATAPEQEVNTDDELDLESDKATWKLRELKRIRRERLLIEEQEREREEIERRRNMTAEEREAEDREYIESQKEDLEGRGKMAYMQKYFHKGAFFNNAGEEDEEVKAVLNRDLAGARFVDEAGDKSVLPEYMRIRDMTQLGRKGRTKYKDLKQEDTGRWGQDVGRKKREYDGVDERFRSDDERGGGGKERTGANNAPVGERRRREDEVKGERDEKRARYD